MDVYNETRLEGKRAFTLTTDGVAVRADIVMGSKYETHIRYDQLDPWITTIKQHHQLFWKSIIGTPLFAIAAFLIVQFMGPSLDNPLLGMVGGLSLICVIVAVITRKRIEYARFCSDAGIPLLDVARSGPDADRFEEFIAQIQKNIEHAKDAAVQMRV